MFYKPHKIPLSSILFDNLNNEKNKIYIVRLDFHLKIIRFLFISFKKLLKNQWDSGIEIKFSTILLTYPLKLSLVNF